jgi:hypothetical protein
MNYENIGSVIEEIPVNISYRIIELFSAGLYSSPNKAFEELVSNSYDALASKVCISINEKPSYIWICDNGTSMDTKELKILWNIGASNKRNNPDVDRPPIGKFGIGKLATYVLTRKLTYICKKSNKYYAVTMDYNAIDRSKTEIKLKERELSLQQCKDALGDFIKNNDPKLSFKLWDKGCETNWTFVILTNLKPLAEQIQNGRLKWVLSTALPLSPGFELRFNGEDIGSSKMNLTPIKTWTIGNDKEFIKESKTYSEKEVNGQYYMDLPFLKDIRGSISLYRDSLLRGKDTYGRSHGIFLMVRKRLINLDDPLLGLPALSHGVFNRVRFEIHADGLDEYITSPRESIKESEALGSLKKYIQRKFEDVKAFYFNFLENEGTNKTISEKIAFTSANLSRKPIVTAVKKYFNGEIDDLFLTRIPQIPEKEQDAYIAQLEEELTEKTGIIQDVKIHPLNIQDPIAVFDLETRTANINLLHPFVANHIDDFRTITFQLFAISEILTEAYLIENGISLQDTKEIMKKRDSLFRTLMNTDRLSAPYVASLIQAALADANGLERAVANAFSTLGFETIALGKSNKPDGKANAILGPKNSALNYSLVYDTKSTDKDRIMASTAHISGIDRHRDNYHADFAVIVAIDFQGAEDPNSAISQEAKKHNITLIRAKDLMTLILLAAPKLISLSELRELFERHHTVIETSKWINNLKNKKVKKAPIKELLETVYDLMKNDIEPADISSIRHTNKKIKEILTNKEIEDLVRSLVMLVPGMISLEGNIVSIQAKPDTILRLLEQSLKSSDIPGDYRDSYIKQFSLN